MQNSVAIMESIDLSVLSPGKLEELSWDDGLKVGDLVAYFNGKVLTIEHKEDGWTEEKAVPRCPETKVLEAVTAAVTAGNLWLISGPASVWAEDPPAGVVTKAAILRQPPAPIDVSSLTPEALSDAWTGETTTALGLAQALAAQRGVAALPWKLVETAVIGAIGHGFLRALPGPVTWPCQQHEAGAMALGLPAVGGGTGPKVPGVGEPPQYFSPIATPNVWSAVMDSSQLANLTEAMSDILAAADGYELRFRLSVEVADGSEPKPVVRKRPVDALPKVTIDAG